MASVETNSETASDIFQMASATAPSSVTAQGAVIAEQCLQYNLSPLELCRRLVHDPQRVDEITKVAMARHSRAGKGPTDISQSRAIDIITADFSVARRLIETNIPELSSIYGEIYQEAKNTADPNTTIETRVVREIEKRFGINPYL